MMFAPAPFLLKDASVSQVMTQVCLALIPGIAAYAWLVGPAILVQLVIASLTAVAAEAAMLKLRGKPLAMFLSDGSAIVTAWLIALTFPPLAPWWLVVTGTLFAIVIAKHLYGGLGQNPFNPAMVAFAACIVSFPALMSQWPSVGLQMPLLDQLNVILGLAPRVDALSGATPLDAMKTALKLGEGQIDIAHLLANQDIYGNFAGRGWEWVATGYLLGGLWLWRRKLVTWHAPVAFLAAMVLVSGALWLYQPASFASPVFHLLSGGTMLGAFFIITDPVSGCTTPRGKLIFGFSAGLLAYIIRVFGGYPDGVAFAVLLMNLSAPLIDQLTQPRIFGMKGRQS
ncbi:electron transport complex subunit RsxD [Azonexus hydrophilus]|uniref:Ion-translocating oxidoreductase complex subunit D n=1 Tax=Azonexus hydrophilus TaxID=418702 RepID=A0A1R1I6V4_9RHOO|nr:RnfABCDGE type electron transport complex subunit D [Azonexus hydrophilus]OMG54508.1 electron transport complex subunit RsxD [Azonexus hydrophilus]